MSVWECFFIYNEKHSQLTQEMNSITRGHKGPLPVSIPETQQSRAAPSPVLNTGVLFAGKKEVTIVHGAETYRLSQTRQNRLILTK